jgi:hypothetical protein
MFFYSNLDTPDQCFLYILARFAFLMLYIESLYDAQRLHTQLQLGGGIATAWFSFRAIALTKHYSLVFHTPRRLP